MAEAHRSVPYAMAPSAAALKRARADVRNGHALDSGAEINVCRWDELSDEDLSNWTALWQATRERPELSPDFLRAQVSAGFVREPRLVWLADRSGWLGALVLGAHPKLPRPFSERHLTSPWGGEVIGLPPVVEPGFEPQFAAHLMTWLHSQRRRVLATDLRGLSNNTVVTNAIVSQAAESFDLSMTTELNVPYRRLDGLWTPQTHASRKLREQLRKRARQLNGRQWGLVCADRAIDADGFDRAFDGFVKIEGTGWKKGIGALAQDPARLRYYQLLFRDARNIGARIYSLLIDETVAASMIVIHAHDRFLQSRIAYNETYKQYSPGVLLIAATLEAISRECPTAVVDTGGEPTAFSQRWFDTHDERVRICLYARTPAGRLYRHTREGLSRMRRALWRRRLRDRRGGRDAGDAGPTTHPDGLSPSRSKG